MAHASQVRAVRERGPRINGMDSEEEIFALLKVSADPDPAFGFFHLAPSEIRCPLWPWFGEYCAQSLSTPAPVPSLRPVAVGPRAVQLNNRTTEQGAVHRAA